MKAPKHLDFTPGQVEELINRLNEESLRKEDYPLLANLVQAIVWLSLSLQEKKLTIKRLQAIFGIKTESAKKLAKFIDKQAASESTTDNQASNTTSNTSSSKGKGGHGHKPASEYTQAEIFSIAHQALKKGDVCPSCLKGRLFNLSAGSVIRIVGQPWLKVEVYKPERLRCSVCGRTFTASLPREIATGSRADISAKTIVCLLKYRAGIPFYRQGQIQDILNTPISPSEIWEMTEDVADALQPIYTIMLKEAATAELLQNDDTKARILSVMKERQERKDAGRQDKRTGTFTTGILANNKGVKIALYFTGIKHAGENLDILLDKRPHGLSPPIQQCDGGHNEPENHDTHLSNCNAHCRRKFYELVEVWPKIVIKIISWYSAIFHNEKLAPSDPLMRLKWHQEKSRPIMKELKRYCDNLIEQKEVEPNSSMGKAIAYLQNHWEGLTLFLRMPGVPLHNNETEQLLKRAVLNRKNALFYRNETGAKIGDILMSVIETCALNVVNPWEYLIAIQKYQKDVWANPSLWMPWSYEERLKEQQPPALQESLLQ